MEREGDVIGPRSRQEPQTVLTNTFGHCHKTINTAYKIADEPSVPEMRFVGDNVVQDGHDTDPLTPRQACHSAQTRCHQRYPELHDDQFDACFPDFARRSEPRERIDAVQRPADMQSVRLRSIGILRLAGEQEIGILEGESEDFHLVPFRHKLTCETFVERRQTAPIRPTRTYYAYTHTNPKL